MQYYNFLDFLHHQYRKYEQNLTWKSVCMQIGVLPSAWFRWLNHIIFVGQIQHNTYKIKKHTTRVCFDFNWLRSVDLNHRPSGYEPDELPGCSTPRQTGWIIPVFANLSNKNAFVDF